MGTGSGMTGALKGISSGPRGPGDLFWALQNHGGAARGKLSWMDKPRNVAAYRLKRKRKKQRLAKQRRARMAKGQNPRTGA